MKASTEFLSPLVGSEYDRKGARKATREVGGVSSQQLRHIDILLLSPWRLRLGKANGFPLTSTKQVLVANPVTFLTQKILIHKARERKERAKDLLYIHDTIETFAGNLEELRELFTKKILPKLQAKKAREVSKFGDALFGNINDTIREAAQVAGGRRLKPEALAETCRAGLKAIFE